MKHLSIPFLIAALAACGGSEPKAPAASTPPNAQTEFVVTAERVPGGVKLTNSTTASLEYVLVNPQWLGLLASCRDAAMDCPTLAAGASVVVPHQAIHGYAPGSGTIEVRYWLDFTSTWHPQVIEVK